MLHLFYFTTYSPPISLANYQLLKGRETIRRILVSLIQCQQTKGKAHEVVPSLPTFLPAPYSAQSWLEHIPTEIIFVKTARRNESNLQGLYHSRYQNLTRPVREVSPVSVSMWNRLEGVVNSSLF